MVEIRLADTDEEILACFPVMHELRPHLVDAEFVQRIRTQQREGYRLCYLAEGQLVRCVAGFRLRDNLAHGRILYVDDLATDSNARSKGYGKKMLEWLTAEGRTAGCATLELDSGVQRFDAHRFYLRNRMNITSHHFSVNLKR